MVLLPVPLPAARPGCCCKPLLPVTPARSHTQHPHAGPAKHAFLPRSCCTLASHVLLAASSATPPSLARPARPLPQREAERHLPQLTDPAGLTLEVATLQGRRYSLQYRFWENAVNSK